MAQGRQSMAVNFYFRYAVHRSNALKAHLCSKIIHQGKICSFQSKCKQKQAKAKMQIKWATTAFVSRRE